MTSYRNGRLALDLAALELKLYAFTDAVEHRLERRYNPDQPRVPAGNSDGGQWTSIGGSEGSAAASSGERGGGSQGHKPVRTAFAGRLDNVQLLHMEGTYFWMCYYKDMLGRKWGRSLQIDRICPDTYPAPPTVKK
jgi:hypothetical protein